MCAYTKARGSHHHAPGTDAAGGSIAHPRNGKISFVVRSFASVQTCEIRMPGVSATRIWSEPLAATTIGARYWKLEATRSTNHLAHARHARRTVLNSDSFTATTRMAAVSPLAEFSFDYQDLPLKAAGKK